MTDILEKEITSGPVPVSIRGSIHPLAYPMHNVIVYKQQTGDSLFDTQAWPRIDLQQDPGRWLACLWAGLHQQQSDKSWKAPYTIEELGALVDFGNAAEISIAMVKALLQFMPKPKDDAPKAPAPGELAQSENTTTISPSSGPEPAAATVSVAKSS